MSHSAPRLSRAAFHALNAPRARAEAQRLLAERERLQGRWLDWVAAELYALGPPPFVAMVRRELQAAPVQ